LIFVGYRFQTVGYIEAKPAREMKTTYDRVWFDDRDALLTARLENDVLHITRTRWAGRDDLQWDVPMFMAEGGQWSVSMLATRIAWIAPDGIHARRVHDSSDEMLEMPEGVRPLAVTVLNDDSVAAVFDNGSVRHWIGATFQDSDLGLGRLAQAVAEGEYIAAASATSSQLVLFHRSGSQWTVTERGEAPAQSFRLALPAPGYMATIASGLLRFGGTPRNTRGAVRSIASYYGILIVSGQFDNIWVVNGVNDTEEDYEVAQAPSGTQIAVGSHRLAATGPAGTALHSISIEERLTSSGRWTVVLGALLALCNAILFLFPMLLRQFFKLFSSIVGGKGKKEGGRLPPEKLGTPPLQLLDAILNGRCALWAGAGLSAQSGSSTRAAFVGAVLNAATAENWIASADTPAIRQLWEKGDVEGAMARIKERSARPEDLGLQIGAMIPKYQSLSKCHDMLARMPLSAAITTNYDALLERMPTTWAQLVLTPSSEQLPRVTGVQFLLKLYGDPTRPATLAFSRADWSWSMTSAAKELLRRVGEQGSLLFVGCSPEALLADLDALGMAPMRAGRHFAVVGTSKPDWKQTAEKLKGLYSIDVIACQEKNIAAELPLFLEHLLRSIVDRRQPPPPVNCENEPKPDPAVV
jgi:hypothetical protein